MNTETRNEMEEEVPDWLNTEFLESVLKNEVKGTDIAVTKFDVQPAVPKGDNYGSSLHRVVVEFSFKDGSSTTAKISNVIVKSLPLGEMVQQLAAQTGTFKRETEVYHVILPAMYKLAQEVSGRAVQHLSSKCLYAIPDIIVMEDLTALGYRMADRRTGLDLPHCKVALKSLAHFHGMSVALYNKDPSSMANMIEGFFKEERRPILEMFLGPAFQCLASVVEKWSGYERFGDKIRKIAETCVDKMIDIVKPIDGSLSVLNHGDFWVNNMLFRYSSDTNRVQEVMFVDFQLSCFSSPALDLQYFIYTSPNEEVRFQHMDELLEVYHTELTNILQVLNCNRIQFTLEQLKKEFQDKAFIGLVTSFTLLNLVLSDPKNAININELTEGAMKSGENNPLGKGYSNPLFQDQFQKLLLHYESKNLL